MRFIITRTSCIDDESPCEGAKRIIPKFRYDKRTFRTLEEWQQKLPEDFERKIYSTGYTKEGGTYALVDNYEAIYIIEVESVQKLVDKFGTLIIRKPYTDYADFEDYYEIEIYDDYRE